MHDIGAVAAVMADALLKVTRRDSEHSDTIASASIADRVSYGYFSCEFAVAALL